MRRRILLVAFVAVLAADIAIACGPFFPWELLDNRSQTLKSTPKNSFAFEAQHLVTATDKLKAVEYDPWSGQDRDNAFASAENAGLTEQQAAALQSVRGTRADNSAYAAGVELPESVRLYTAGAVDFTNADYADALKRFQAVFALKPADQRRRGVWAAYMMGRTDLRLGDEARAAGSFRLTQMLAARGWPDPLGLGAASFGEEAQSHFYRAIALLQNPGGKKLPAVDVAEPKLDTNGFSDTPPVDKTLTALTLAPANAAAYGNEIATAVALYAEQAARGSDSGVQSLKQIAEHVLAQPARIDATIGNGLVERLLVAYVLARVDDIYVQQPSDTYGLPAPDAGTRDRNLVPNPLLARLVGTIQKAGLANVSGADRLAALAYRLGRYDLAGALAKRSHGPIASWVEAKLALQRGDLASAEKFYADAAHGFPGDLDSDNRNLVRGEGGTIALARGEFTEALALLYPTGNTYWGDVAYVAERVLTIDELKSFVDANVPQPTGGPPASGQLANPAALLRDLLGRRLVREGRTDEATKYLQDPKIRDAVTNYAADLAEAKSDWGRVDRAEASYRAAVLARESGLEMMGTEEVPDLFYFNGSYDTGLGRDAATGPYVTKDERDRVAASRAVPDRRFHYRFIAVNEASQAADLLPPRSQAFAAVLCHATGWMMSTDGAQKDVHALYHRYVKQGAHVAWAKRFGRVCPDPDFNAAISLERMQPFRDARHFVSKHRVLSVAGGGGVLVLVGLLIFLAMSGRLGGLFRRED